MFPSTSDLKHIPLSEWPPQETSGYVAIMLKRQSRSHSPPTDSKTAFFFWLFILRQATASEDSVTEVVCRCRAGLTHHQLIGSISGSSLEKEGTLIFRVKTDKALAVTLSKSCKTHLSVIVFELSYLRTAGVLCVWECVEGVTLSLLKIKLFF